MRKVKTTVLAVALSLILVGCSIPGSNSTLSREEMIVKLLAYMEERYGTYFQLVRTEGGGMLGGPPNGASVIALDYPECGMIRVHWTREWWQDTFWDKFLYCPMGEQYRVIAERAATAHFPASHTEVDLYGELRGPRYPDSFNGDTTFEEFYQWGRDVIDVDVIVAVPATDVNDYEIQSAALESDLRQLFPIGSLSQSLFTPDNLQAWIEFEDPSPDHDSSTEPTRWDIPREDRFFHEWGQ